MVIVKIIEPNMNTRYLEATDVRLDAVTKDDIYLHYRTSDYLGERAIYLTLNIKDVSLIINDVEYLHKTLINDYDKINALLEEQRIEEAIDSLP